MHENIVLGQFENTTKDENTSNIEINYSESFSCLVENSMTISATNHRQINAPLMQDYVESLKHHMEIRKKKQLTVMVIFWVLDIEYKRGC